MGRIRLPGIVIGALSLCLGVAGCGGGGGTSSAVELTKRLPAGAPSYRVVDLTTLRADLGLPEDADPLAGDLALITTPVLGTVPGVAGTEVAAALDLGLATAAATAADSVTVLATQADTGDIGSSLGDLGFEDRGGILERPGAARRSGQVEQVAAGQVPGETGLGPASAAVRLEEGLIFFADDPALLRGLPAEPLDDLPAELLTDLDDAPVIDVTSVDTCFRETGKTAEADGSGELAFLVDGIAEADRLTPESEGGFTFGEPKVDGDLITVPVSSDSPGFAALNVAAALLTTYDCG